MKIANITASLHRHAIEIEGIAEAVEHRQFVFVEVETESGETGFGVTGQFLPWSIIPCVEQHILPAIKGMDIRDTERIHHAVWKKLNPRTYTGVISNALSAIDIALWDIKGKRLGVPIYDLMGGKTRQKVRCYMHVRGDTLDKLVQDAVAKVRQGFTRL